MPGDAGGKDVKETDAFCLTAHSLKLVTTKQQSHFVKETLSHLAGSYWSHEEQAKVLDWSMKVGMGPLNLNETYSYLKQGDQLNPSS